MKLLRKAIVPSLVCIILIALNGKFFHIADPDITSPTAKSCYKDSMTFLRVDTATVTEDNNSSRIQVLTGMLLQEKAIERQVWEGREDRRTQARGFYLTILAGLLSTVFVVKMNRKKTKVAWVAIAVSLLMYSLDIQVFDVMMRAEPRIEKLNTTLQQVIETRSKGFLRLDLFHGGKDADHFYQNDFARKMQRACNPNLEQLILYFFPLIGLLLLVYKYSSAPSWQSSD